MSVVAEACLRIFVLPRKPPGGIEAHPAVGRVWGLLRGAERFAGAESTPDMVVGGQEQHALGVEHLLGCAEVIVNDRQHLAGGELLGQQPMAALSKMPVGGRSI